MFIFIVYLIFKVADTQLKTTRDSVNTPMTSTEAPADSTVTYIIVAVAAVIVVIIGVVVAVVIVKRKKKR